MRFKINSASLIVGRKFTVFDLFCFVFEGNFQVQPRGGGLYSEGRFNGGFFTLRVWENCIWRGLYMEGLIFGILRYFIIYEFCFISFRVECKRSKFFKVPPLNETIIEI